MPLSKDIAAREAQIKSLRMTERKSSSDPRLAYEAGVRAAELTAQMDKLVQHRSGNHSVIRQLENIILYLEQSPHQSAHRTLVLRHIEDAQSRLLRENGN